MAAIADAVYNGNLIQVQKLLESKVNPNTHSVLNQTFFIRQPNALAITQLLLDSHADPNGRKGRPACSMLIHEAAHYNKPDMIALLLDHKADVNVVTHHFRLHHFDAITPLNNAIESRNQVICQMLLNHDARYIFPKHFDGKEQDQFLHFFEMQMKIYQSHLKQKLLDLFIIDIGFIMMQYISLWTVNDFQLDY